MSRGRVLLWCGAALLVAAVLTALLADRLWLAVAGLLAYTGLLVLLVLRADWGAFAAAVTHGPRGKKQITLTFDDGPHPEHTRRILALLRERGHLATFFVIGSKAERYPQVLSEIVAQGHALGVHGYHHSRTYSFKSSPAVQQDIEKARAVVERLVGIRPRWFRPPVGQVSPRTAAGIEAAGIQLILWACRGRDGLERATGERVANRILKRMRDGDIVLLHDAAERDQFVPASLVALPWIQAEIDRRGWRTVHLETLLADGELAASGRRDDDGQAN